jgi:hypothetical protein
MRFNAFVSYEIRLYLKKFMSFMVLGAFYLLLLIFYKLLEPDLCFTLKVDSSFCDSDVCDGLLGPAEFRTLKLYCYKTSECVYISSLALNPMVKWTAFLLSIWELPASNLRPQVDYTNKIFVTFHLSLQVNSCIIPLRRPQFLPLHYQSIFYQSSLLLEML